MDIKKLQAILMTRGIRVTDDDPIFTLVALNESVLEDMTKKHQQALNSASAKNPSISPVKNTPSVNPWLAGFGTFGALGGFMLGLALNKDSLLSMALGFIVIVVGGIGCFFTSGAKTNINNCAGEKKWFRGSAESGNLGCSLNGLDGKRIPTSGKCNRGQRN